MTRRSDLMVGLGLLALIVLGTLYFASQRTPPLATSASGHSGLILYLTSKDVDARRATFAGVDPSQVGLRILPIMDTDLNK
ncbi:MAG: hypothetical protein AAGA78_10580, partial [Pseudomonadota bacterium]